jgi:hypothetical protein
LLFDFDLVRYNRAHRPSTSLTEQERDMNDPRHPTVPSSTGHPTVHSTAQPQRPAQPGLHPSNQPLRPPVQPLHSQQHAQPGLHPQRPVPVAPPQTVTKQIVDDEPLALVEEELPTLDEVASAPAASKIKFGPESAHKKHVWKRTPFTTGQGACRVKSFHAKYSDQGIEHIDDQINEWLDDNPGIEVKFVTTTVHVFEGKIREPAIVMNVWY